MPALKKIGAAALSAFGFTGGAAAVTANFLVVAGGGSGGANGSGGGGAGGFRTSAGTSGGGASAEAALSLSLTQSYTVIVGAGGPTAGAGSASIGNPGSNSSFGSLITSVGGGYGGQYNTVGGAGGSGGGGGGNPPTYAGGAGTANQGYAGGTGANGTYNNGGGGGGAGAVGSNASSGAGGNGGSGVASSISGSSVTYAGGGGGAGDSRGSSNGSGGSGGGGNAGSSSAGVSGSANTGGGGGGGGFSTNISGAGGSGIVIISYTGAQQFGGGVVTTAAGNTIHTFYTSGTLSPLSSLSASYLIVAGGAGAGGGVGGAGGAGGMVTGSGLTVDTSSTYIITVGAGGTGTTTGVATNGSNSSFSSYSNVAIGGGGGASWIISTPLNGASGGSGGGAGPNDSVGSTGTPGSGTAGQGYAGGSSYGGPNAGFSGGGGGAGQVGFSASSGVVGNGGNGAVSSISGTATYYAGGGGGATAGTGSTQGVGGLGGGGNGSKTSTGGNGTTNLGGGGGAGGYDGTVRSGGNGGSGIVIIAYAGSTQQMAGGNVTITGGNVIHTFTSSGYLTPITYFSNSLRFRSSATAYLNRTPTVASTRQKYTISVWTKRGTLGVANMMLTANLYSGTTTYDRFMFQSDDTLFFDQITSNTISGRLTTTQVFRDPAAWYHLVVAVDTAQATSSDRYKMYVNGVQVTAFSTATYPSQNFQGSFLNTVYHGIGYGNATGNAYDGYMTNYQIIDGQQLTPNAFGTFNSYGVWQPVKYGGSYGTNGFFLPFTNTANTTALCYDFSPQGNNWTPNNISLTAGSTYDSMTDVPTLSNATSSNYAVLNPLDTNGSPSITNGNLLISSSSAAWRTARSTISLPLSVGKFYMEVSIGSGTNNCEVGFCSQAATLAEPFTMSTCVAYSAGGGGKWVNGTYSAYGATWTVGDIIGVAYDTTAGTITFYKNNSSQGAISTGWSAGFYSFVLAVYDSASGTTSAWVNFGQQPFVYTPPSGYVALNTYNM